MLAKIANLADGALRVPVGTMLLLSTALFAMVGCSEKTATEIVVAVVSDLTVPTELESFSLTVAHSQSSGSYSYNLDSSKPDPQHLPATLGIVSRDNSATQVTISVEGYKSGTKIVGRAARLNFVPGRTLLLHLGLRRNCVDAPACPSGETCTGDGCRRIDIDSSTLPDYDELLIRNPDSGIIDSDTGVTDGATSDGRTDIPDLGPTPDTGPSDTIEPVFSVTPATDLEYWYDYPSGNEAQTLSGYQLHNSGAVEISYTAKGPADFELTPSSGTISANSSVEVAVSRNKATATVPGEYQGALTFTVGTTIIKRSTALTVYNPGGVTGWKKNTTAPLLTVGQSPQDWDQQAFRSPTVVDLGSGNYRMWYLGKPTSGPFQVGMATSVDFGDTWERYANNPVITVPPSTASDDDLTALTVHHESGSYRMWYSKGQNNSSPSIHTANSVDGITWSKSPLNPIMTAGTVASWDGGGVSHPSVFKIGNDYWMYYLGRTSLDPGSEKPSVGLAVSSDGVFWAPSSANPVVKNIDAPTAFHAMIDENSVRLWASRASGGGISYSSSIDGISFAPMEAIGPFDANGTGDWDASGAGDFAVLRQDAATLRIWYTSGGISRFESLGLATNP